MFDIIITIQGVSLRIESNNAEYIEYLRKIFNYNTVNQHIDINVTLNWQESLISQVKPYEFSQINELRKFGRRIWVGKNEILWNDIGSIANFKMQFQCNEVYHINAYYSLILSKYFIKRYYKQILRKKSFKKFKEDLFESITYYLLYYPIIYKLEHRGLYIAHASSVQFKNRGILIPGLPGVGKSTLSLGLLSCPCSKFLSDNIVLYDSEKIYACYEPIKLDDNSVKLLPDKGNKLEKIGLESYYGRTPYKIRKEYLVDSTIPEILIIPCQSKKQDIYEITSEKAVQLIMDFNKIAGEVCSYSMYSSVQNMHFKFGRIEDKKIDILKSLTDKLKCYFVCIEANKPLENVINQISRLF